MTEATTFDTFYRGTVRRLTRYAFGLTGDAAEAQDLAQEAYARAWQRWRRLRGYDDAEAWLRIVVNRLATDRWRRLRVRRNAAAAARPAAPVPPPSEETVLLVTALRELPWEQRQVLLLHHLMDRSLAEIAEETGTNVNTVKSRLSRGRTALARELRLDESADALAPDAPEAARRRGRNRSLRAVTGAAVCVLLVAGLVSILVRGRSGGVEPPPPLTTTPSQAPPTTFTKLSRVGSPVPIDDTLSFGTVAVSSDRAFVATQQEGGRLSVTAVDVRTGAKIWGPLALATFGDAAYVVWHPTVVLVMGRHDNGTRPDGSIFALDPATGRQLMRVDVDSFEADDIVAGESTLVIGSRPDRTTRGYDLLTGKMLWSVPDPGDSPVVHSLPMEGSSSVEPGAMHSSIPIGVPVAASRFVQLLADGTAVLHDLATGRELSRRAGAVSASPGPQHDDVAAADGVLYAATPFGHAGWLKATDLDHDGAPKTAYQAGGEKEIFLVQTCGGLICFHEGSRTQSGDEIVAFDPHTGRVAWRQGADARNIAALGGAVIVGATGRDIDQRSMVVDGAGRQLLSADAQAGAAYWIDSGAVLIFRPSPDGLAIRGVSPLTAAPAELGTLPGGGSCGWNATRLVCIGTGGITVYRYAAP